MRICCGGAPRIHGELLKLGFVVTQSTVAKYMARRGDPFGQTWGTFLRNYAPRIAAMDLFLVPMVGSGYGDPLDRDPELVLQDVLDRAISLKHARNIYGVVLNAAGHAIDTAARDELRKTMQADRLRSAKPVSAGRQAGKLPLSNARVVMRIHESLDIIEHEGEFSIACRKCSQDFGPATGNYKREAMYRVVEKDELTELPPPGGRRSMANYIEYYCPGCATLLDVETSCPTFENGKFEPIWDIQIAANAIRKAATLASDG